MHIRMIKMKWRWSYRKLFSLFSRMLLFMQKNCQTEWRQVGNTRNCGAPIESKSISLLSILCQSHFSNSLKSVKKCWKTGIVSLCRSFTIYCELTAILRKGPYLSSKRGILLEQRGPALVHTNFWKDPPILVNPVSL